MPSWLPRFVALVLATASCQALLDLEPMPDAAAPGQTSDSGPTCGAGEKRCGGRCVTPTDPAFGCTRAGCEPCAGFGIAEFACAVDKCLLLRCKDTHKMCGDSCVPRDAAHGCGADSCGPCPGNAAATCKADQCALDCAKSCAGKCVSTDDPTYGCASKECATCPSNLNEATICQGGVCGFGECPPNTKQCGGVCVPMDANYGCSDMARCTPCNNGELCSDGFCKCNEESSQVTCATKACGPAMTNCGATIICVNTCQSPNTCGGGGAGPNGCGCSSKPICFGIPCGTPVTDGCNNTVTCVSDGCI